MTANRPRPFSPKSYQETSSLNTLSEMDYPPLASEKTEKLFSRLYNNIASLHNLSLAAYKQIIIETKQLSKSQDLIEAIQQLITCELYYQYQLGKINRNDLTSVIPFPTNFHQDFLRAANKSIYFLFLQEHSMAHYKKCYLSELKRGNLNPELSRRNHACPDDNPSAFLTFLKDNEMQAILFNNFLFYKDHKYLYATRPNNINWDHVPYYFNKDLPLKIFNNQYKAYFTSADQKNIVLADRGNQAINTFEVCHDYGKIPHDVDLTKIETSINNIKIHAIKEQENFTLTLQIDHGITIARHYQASFAPHPNILSLTFDDQFNIGQHLIKSEEDIAKIKSIAGRSVEKIEKIMKESDGGNYSSAGFIRDEDNLLTVLKEDYAKCKHYNITNKQIAAILTLIINAANLKQQSITLGRDIFYIEDNRFACRGNKLPLSRNGNWGWARPYGLVGSPFDDSKMDSQDIFIKKNKSNTEGFGFASCFEPMIRNYGFCERGYYYFKIDKFVKFLNLNQTYHHLEDDKTSEIEIKANSMIPTSIFSQSTQKEPEIYSKPTFSAAKNGPLL